MTNNWPDEPNNQASDPFAWDEAQVEAALPGFLLGALEPDEMLAVDAFLRENASLRARAQALQLTVDELAYSVPPIAPPTAVTDQILARVKASSVAGAETAASELPTLISPRVLPPIRPVETPGFWERVGGWWRHNFAPAIVGVGTAAVLLLGGFYLSQLQGQVGGLQEQLAAAQSANAQLQEINESLQSQLTERERQLANFATADTVLALGGTDDAPTAGALFTLTGDQATLVAFDLPAIDADQTYQLWLIPADGDPVPAGLLAAQRGGAATWNTTVPLQSGDFAAVGLSIEPAGGSSAPTGPIVLLGTTT